MYQNLTKEQQRALDIVSTNLPFLHPIPEQQDRVRADAPLLPTNFIAAWSLPFVNGDLPHREKWFWNQSNSKITMPIDDSTVVVFKKISTKRLSVSHPRPPHFKVWIYQVHKQNKKPFYFLWCEKGVEGGVKTDIGVIFPESISLSSLSFLSPFLDDETTAKELGWN